MKEHEITAGDQPVYHGMLLPGEEWVTYDGLNYWPAFTRSGRYLEAGFRPVVAARLCDWSNDFVRRHGGYADPRDSESDQLFYVDQSYGLAGVDQPTVYGLRWDGDADGPFRYHCDVTRPGASGRLWVGAGYWLWQAAPNWEPVARFVHHDDVVTVEEYADAARPFRVQLGVGFPVVQYRAPEFRSTLPDALRCAADLLERAAEPSSAPADAPTTVDRPSGPDAGHDVLYRVTTDGLGTAFLEDGVGTELDSLQLRDGDHDDQLAGWLERALRRRDWETQP